MEASVETPVETRADAREISAPSDHLCVMRPSIDHCGRSLNDAHAKLRDHASQLAELKSISAHLVERVTRSEGHATEQHRLLITLQGGMEAIRTEQGISARTIESMSRVSQGTHDMLMKHVENSRIRDEELSADRVRKHETATTRTVKLAGIASGIFLLLAMLHGVATGQPLWAALMGMIR